MPFTKLETKLITLLTHPKMGTLKDSRAIEIRLAGCGFTKTCSRCLGSGKYSYNQMDGDKCYGCGGSGKNPMKVTRDLVSQVEVFVAEGKLDAYAAECVRKGERKRIALAVQKRVDAAESAMRWRAFWYPKDESGSHYRVRGEFSQLAYNIHDWASKITGMAHSLSTSAQMAREQDIRDGSIELLAKLADDFVLAIEAVDQAWDAAQASGEVAADIAEGARLHALASGPDSFYQQESATKRNYKRAGELVMASLNALLPGSKIITMLENRSDKYGWKKGYDPLA